MKTKNLTFLTTALTLLVFTLIGNFAVSRSVTAQKDIKTPNLADQTKTISFVKNEKKANRDIPDKVAYELFLRTVGEYNAKGLVERAGFAESEVEKIVTEAKSLNELLILNDEAARRIRESKDNLSASEIKTEVDKIRAKNDEMINRTVDRYLLAGLTVENANKLKDFINSEVKNNITVVTKPKTSKGEVSFLKTSTKSSLQTGGELYLYSAAWQSGMDVFGAGTLSEQYQSSTSYRVTTIVTSPSGRSNTTVGDWNYASLSNNTGLSVGVEDGTYTIQSSYEQAEGYYDEYGNFVGTGSTNVGSSNSSVVVAPSIVLSGAIITPNQFFISGNPPTGSGTGVVSATIIATQSVPEDTTVEFDFYETVNNAPRVGYTVVAGISTGYTPFPTGNRQTRRKIPNSGQIETLGTLFTINLGNESNVGTVTNQLRINRIIAAANGGNGGVQGENSQVPAVFTLSPAPTPTPSPTPTGGGSGNIGGVSCYFGGGAATPCSSGYGSNGNYCCPYSSPLLLDIDGDGYAMTDYYEGVPFDVNGDGSAGQTSWTAANSDDAWIVLDRNENNRIDSGLEMFGDASEQPAAQNPRNGFSSLAVFDTTTRGGNADGKITRRDTVFRKLRLWQDRNHNGISEPEELSRLPALDVVAVFLNYRESRRTDLYGNRFKFRAKVRDRNDARVGRWAWDVFLVISPPPQTVGLMCPTDNSGSTTVADVKLGILPDARDNLFADPLSIGQIGKIPPVEIHNAQLQQ